jgi:hypothetical protein
MGNGFRKNTFRRDHTIACDGCFDRDQELNRLRVEIQSLKLKVSKIERKVTKKDVLNAHTPSSKIPYKKNSTSADISKQGGGKIGHKGVGRSRANAEAEAISVELDFSRCPDCDVNLKQKDFIKRTIVDVAPVKAKRVELKVSRCICPKCKKSFIAKPAVMPRCLYSNRLIAQCAVMHYLHGIPLGKVIELLGDEVTQSGLLDAFQRLGKTFEPVMAVLKKEFRSSAVKHADETGWRTDGKSGYAWLFATPTLSIFEFTNTRSARIPLELMGSDPLPGVLVVDRYNGYNKVPCKIQYCYAHLLREMEKLEVEFQGNTEITEFCAEAGTLSGKAQKLRNLPIEDTVFYREAKELKKEIQKIMRHKYAHLGIKRIQQIFIINKKRLYHWADNREVPAENNRAERELRPTVIARKSSFGSQSVMGAKTRGIFQSLLFTARKRNKEKSVEEWFEEALNEFCKSPAVSLEKMLFSAA